MRIEALGDAAWLLTDLGAIEPWRLSAGLRGAGLAGVTDVTAAYDAVAVYGDWPGVTDDELARLADSVMVERREHVVPVEYGRGPDLAAAAEALGLAQSDVVRIHSGASYRCHALGFCPGFAYLGYLPDELARLERLGSPRVRVSPGSVGIAGRQTAIYPAATPGGWWLIGVTPLVVADAADGFFPIAPGDTVRFEPIDAAEFARLAGHRL